MPEGNSSSNSRFQTVLKRHREESRYNGSYNRDAFLRFKNICSELSKEDMEELKSGFLILNDSRTQESFLGIQPWDVIGCITLESKFNPRLYLVTEKDKMDSSLSVVIWDRNLEKIDRRTSTLNQKIRIGIEDISLSIAMDFYSHMYRYNPKTENFHLLDQKACKTVRIVSSLSSSNP